MPKIQAKVLKGTSAALDRLAAALRRGRLVAVPTETVYGLAANALSARACGRIFKAKGRPTDDPLIVHIHDLAQWEELAEVNEEARKVARAFWPGALTIVLPKKSVVPDLATAGLPSVAVRMPAHPLFQKLLRASGLPLAAPSANPFGYVSPTTAEHVRAQLGSRIPFILDGGPCAIGVESTILDLRDPARPEILRPGAVSAAEIGRVLRKRIPVRGRRVAKGTAAVAPGMLTQHYSPHTPVKLYTRMGARALREIANDEVVLHFRRPSDAPGLNHHWLSARGDHEEAARELFGKLRELDGAGCTCIHAQLAPGRSALALAINDRLTRAAAKR